jgi:hypothetical protein
LPFENVWNLPEIPLVDFPFWLPAGATLAASSNVTYLSVIEFNIVQ